MTRRTLTLVSLGLLMLLALLGAGFTLREIGVFRALPAPPVEAGAVKISVAEDGIYRVPFTELARAGLSVDAADGPLALAHAAEPVPYLLEDEALIFYGQSSDDKYDPLRYYILRAEPQAASSLVADPTMVLHDPASDASDEFLRTITHTVRLEANYYQESRALQADPAADAWFWQQIPSVGDKAVLEIPFDLGVAPAGAATLTLHFWGATLDPDIQPDHDVDVRLNDVPIGTIAWDGRTFHAGELTVAAETLRQGANTLTLDNAVPGATLVDIVHFDRAELAIPVTPQLVDGRLTIENRAGLVRLSDTATPVILDITDPAQPLRLPFNTEGDTVTFGLTAAQRVAVADETGFLEPVSVETLVATDLDSRDRQADLLIITTRGLGAALDDYMAAREADGISTALAYTDEIYDAFGGGARSAEAIRAFIAFAATEWQAPSPRYVLLVGDATTDPRGYMAQNPTNPVPLPAHHVPSVLVPVIFSGETVSDARLADIDGDNRPDLAIGRWPVASVAEVRAIAARTLAYEEATAVDRAVFTLDGPQDGEASLEFSLFLSDVLARSQYPATQATVLDAPTAGAVTEAWNAGAWIVGYVGHGALDIWGKNEFLNIDHIADFEPAGAQPIVLQFTCLTGQFGHPQVKSISEAMLQHDNGPVLLVAASSLTLSSQQAPFASALLRALQDPAYERIGDAFTTAKAALDVQRSSGLQEVSDTFNLIGDPSARIVRPDRLLTPEG